MHTCVIGVCMYVCGPWTCRPGRRASCRPRASAGSAWPRSLIIYIYIYIYTHVCVHIQYMYIYIYIYVFACVHVYTYIHGHA